jgi:putative ATP-dependent endonuclease of OLD family
MLERYLDVTKSQMFFAKGCLFIEGISEQLLITALSKVLGFVLEDYRIEMVNVDGTSFYPFLFLFNSDDNKKKLPQKVVILTDDDRYTESKKSTYSFENLIANNYLLLNELSEKIRSGSPSTRIMNLLSTKNNQSNIEIKIANKTLEYEICKVNISQNKKEIKDQFLFKYIESIDKDKTDKVLKYLETITGDELDEVEQDKISLLLWKCLSKKTDFAQGFSVNILKYLEEAKESFKVPNYIVEGLDFLK